MVGSLIGRVGWDAEVSNSYAVGGVTGNSLGLAGENNGSISSSYSLIDNLNEWISPTEHKFGDVVIGTDSNTYFCIAVTIQGCYDYYIGEGWSEEDAIVECTVPGFGPEGFTRQPTSGSFWEYTWESYPYFKTASEMKTQSTYEGWNFETIWNINSSINNGYPFLR